MATCLESNSVILSPLSAPQVPLTSSPSTSSRLELQEQSGLQNFTEDRESNEGKSCMTCWSRQDCLSLPCNHRFCNSCLQSQLKFRVDSRNNRDIGHPKLFEALNKCPIFGCKETIHDQIIKHYLSEEEHTQYLDIQLRIALVQMYDIRFCPRPGCNNVGFGSKNCSQVICDQCWYSFCYHCREEAHGILPCREYEDWKITNQPENSEKKALQELRKSSKRCPSCFARSAKIDGCDHVQCSLCGFNYCWGCLQEWGTHDAAHCDNADQMINDYDRRHHRDREVSPMRRQRDYLRDRREWTIYVDRNRIQQEHTRYQIERARERERRENFHDRNRSSLGRERDYSRESERERERGDHKRSRRRS
eukprot:TRINITY_DN15070_c0_g1_i1.p1 TRINITY_DN15070_c0_g1~~TRINITY_DN15070_c0_g1_i1.p1  ORF type:complete len:363 (+),score=36.18 TRINITY_DN15070_c0_g1_i1:28-1116(+)